MIRRELAVFGIVGLLTVLLDFVVYRGWLAALGWGGTELSKAVGFVTGAVFAYFANRFWTFQPQQPPRSNVWRFVALYLLTLAVNVLVNEWSLRWLVPAPYAVPVAFVLATGLSASLNFIGMKLFVFKTLPAPAL